MKMIKKKCFQNNWIINKHEETNADPILADPILVDMFLNDSINTFFLICQLDFSRSIKDEFTKELRYGIRRIKSYILGGKYSLLSVKEDASKVACIASLIRDDRLDTDVKKIK